MAQNASRQNELITLTCKFFHVLVSAIFFCPHLSLHPTKHSRYTRVSPIHYLTSLTFTAGVPCTWHAFCPTLPHLANFFLGPSTLHFLSPLTVRLLEPLNGSSPPLSCSVQFLSGLSLLQPKAMHALYTTELPGSGMVPAGIHIFVE